MHFRYLFILFIISACNSSESLGIELENLANILDYSGTPNTPTDRSVFMFSDLGAWHGYALPEKENAGSFTGPFSMLERNGVWLSKSLSKFTIIDASTKEPIPIDQSKEIQIKSFPNKLHQSYFLEETGLKITAELIFISDRTALIKYTLDQAEIALHDSIQFVWSGTSFDNHILFSKDPKGIKLNFKALDDEGFINFSGVDFESIISDSSYILKSKPLFLEKRHSKEIIVTQSLCFSPQELEEERPIIEKGHKQSGACFLKNEARWKKQVHAVLSKLKPEFQHESHQRAVVKCVQTLNNNWRSPAGFLRHDGLFPSYNYKWFHGFWAWDSWKHAVSTAIFNPVLAQDQIRAMYDFQDEFGMIADCVYRDTIIEQHNWRNTKPPLSVWAILKVFEASQDTSFLEEMLPALEKYHQWWYRFRDHDQNGLCEYGSTDGSLIAAKWESGMDNAVRFDSSALVKNMEGAWSLTQESVDLNAYLCFEKTQLSTIYKILGMEAEARQFMVDADRLKQRIQQEFFNDSLNWFFDIDLESKQHIEIAGAEGWIPLFTRTATPAQAAKMLHVLLDTSKFATYIPFPILSADHPKFKPDGGYWRGPVWLDHSYFAIQSLMNYGLNEEAKKYTDQLINNLEGFKDTSDPIFENYHPLTGKGLESKHFSWSAAHLLLLMVDDDTE